ncbi:MAG: lipoprotein insertase outer membrane protein LolB [Pseudomonadota bacterium]|nr:lipoprotein insertase outer membrane protein LolB [Pseudomonadota bacterium]
MYVSHSPYQTRKTILKITFYLVLLLFTSSCTRVDYSCDDIPSWNSYKSEVSKIENFTLKGKIKVKYDKQISTANFILEQNKSKFSNLIMGPFGITLANITGDDKKETLVLSEDNKSISLRDYMLKNFGANIKHQDLSQILRAIPLKYSYSTYENGYPKSQTTKGFTVNWEKYSCINSVYLPKKINIALTPKAKVTILIQDFAIN